ncbi:hypothetical protein FHR33_002015 [Nonomuraea dietziae]|uniref:Uncharacterized protein n=1 Tax=Nonomuraea dietziae TaxID=65515 RepID=A0A7W5V210_9ACTN|nr:hypothetical protein [Nonomuraea dietziae]
MNTNDALIAFRQALGFDMSIPPVALVAGMRRLRGAGKIREFDIASISETISLRAKAHSISHQDDYWVRSD